jgi:hypothetical protein
MTGTCREQPRSAAHAALATDGERPGSASDAASDNTVMTLWRSCWLQLRACHPELDARLALLERQRPTRARALERLAASAGRAAARCVRGEATPAALLRKLWTWQAAVLVEIERDT